MSGNEFTRLWRQMLRGARYDSLSGERWVLSIAVSHPQFDEHLAKGQNCSICSISGELAVGFGIGFDSAGVESCCEDQRPGFTRRTLANTSACCKDGGGPTQVGNSGSSSLCTTSFNSIIFVAPLTKLAADQEMAWIYFFDCQLS